MSIWAKKWAYEQHPKRIDDEDNITDKKHPAAKAVLVALAEYPGPGQRDCWPSQKTLADMTDMTDRQVRRCLSDLEAQGVIKRTERRRKDGTRRSDRITLCGPIEAFGPPQDADEDQPDESAPWEADQPDERADQADESSGHEPSGEPKSTSKEEESSTESSSSLSGEHAENGSSPSEEVKDLKQYAVGELMDRVNAARARGAPLHSPTNDERRQFGRLFAQASKDGHNLDTLLLAFDYQIAKAAGEIDGEAKAWCGYRTALDRVLEGWRPTGGTGEVDATLSEEQLRKIEENERLLAEILAS